MLCMILLILRINQDVINKHNHELVKLGHGFVKPKDMTRYSYKPYLDDKVVLGISSDLILI
jgi:hypothetical protein